MPNKECPCCWRSGITLTPGHMAFLCLKSPSSFLLKEHLSLNLAHLKIQVNLTLGFLIISAQILFQNKVTLTGSIELDISFWSPG
jgi:hypothetical protein